VSQPAPFNRVFSFTNFQAANPSLPIPGGQVDLELNNAKSTFDGVLTNLKQIQRDDGALRTAASRSTRCHRRCRLRASRPRSRGSRPPGTPPWSTHINRRGVRTPISGLSV
jgi:hypothetical protein